MVRYWIVANKNALRRQNRNEKVRLIPTPIRHGTLYVMWSCGSSGVPFIELSRAQELSELDFGWLRIHIKVDWRPKGWDEAEFQARLSHWLDHYFAVSPDRF